MAGVMPATMFLTTRKRIRTGTECDDVTMQRRLYHAKQPACSCSAVAPACRTVVTAETRFPWGMPADAQVDEDGGDALTAVLGARIDGVVEEVVVRLVLLTVLVVQDLARQMLCLSTPSGLHHECVLCISC